MDSIALRKTDLETATYIVPVAFVLAIVAAAVIASLRIRNRKNAWSSIGEALGLQVTPVAIPGPEPYAVLTGSWRGASALIMRGAIGGGTPQAGYWSLPLNIYTIALPPAVTGAFAGAVRPELHDGLWTPLRSGVPVHLPTSAPPMDLIARDTGRGQPGEALALRALDAAGERAVHDPGVQQTWRALCDYANRTEPVRGTASSLWASERGVLLVDVHATTNPNHVQSVLDLLVAFSGALTRVR